MKTIRPGQMYSPAQMVRSPANQPPQAAPMNGKQTRKEWEKNEDESDDDGEHELDRSVTSSRMLTSLAVMSSSMLVAIDARPVGAQSDGSCSSSASCSSSGDENEEEEHELDSDVDMQESFL